MTMMWCSSTAIDTAKPHHTQGRVCGALVQCFSSLSAINTDMNGRICSALVQFGRYQHTYVLKGLWCSSVLSTLT